MDVRLAGEIGVGRCRAVRQPASWSLPVYSASPARYGSRSSYP